MHNWSKICVKSITICFKFTKDNETCCEKWRFIYSDYKKKRWWISNLIWIYYKSIVSINLLIIKFMYNHVNIILNAHASTFNPTWIKPTYTSSKTTIKFEGISEVKVSEWNMIQTFTKNIDLNGHYSCVCEFLYRNRLKNVLVVIWFQLMFMIMTKNSYYVQGFFLEALIYITFKNLLIFSWYLYAIYVKLYQDGEQVLVIFHPFCDIVTTWFLVKIGLINLSSCTLELQFDSCHCLNHFNYNISLASC